MTKDEADLHVERWRDHWVLEKGFDDDIEAMTVRIGNDQQVVQDHQQGGGGAGGARRTSSTRPCTP